MTNSLRNTLRGLVAVAAATSFIGCKSHEVLPEKIEVTVSRETPDKDCQQIGPVSGSVSKIGQTSEKALENMKTDAARKGANYVHYQTASAAGTGLQGTGYFCP